MTAGWVAPTTRGRALLARTIGADGAREIASAPSWDEARRRLAATAYGNGLAPAADRMMARRRAGEIVAWQLRVLSGWLPPATGDLVRLAVGPFEIGDVDAHLAHLAGAEPVDPMPLGALGTIGRRVARTRTPGEVRQVLSRSGWGDPGVDDPAAIACSMRITWTRRIARAGGPTGSWGLGAAATLLARERFVADREIAGPAEHDLARLLGHGALAAATLEELVDRLATRARWPFESVRGPGELWRSELAVLARVDRDARELSTTTASRGTVVAVIARLLVDMWRVTAAIDAAGRGSVGVEVLDAVAA